MHQSVTNKLVLKYILTRAPVAMEEVADAHGGGMRVEGAEALGETKENKGK
jgi:hypothetical protein